MNLPKPMTRCNYDKLSNLLRDAVKSVTETGMKNAAQTIRENINVNDDDVQVDIGVSVGGSWQRRGFSSLNGVVTVITIGNGKILDTEAICKLCKACNAKEKLKEDDIAAYNLWRSNHECSLNYTGSATNMEPVAAKRIFERSVQKYGLRYTDCYVDGDNKSYISLKMYILVWRSQRMSALVMCKKGLDADYEMLCDEIKVSVVKVNFP